MESVQNRHDLNDAQWEKLEPIIVERLGNWGGSNANDNRVFINARLWIIRTGAPWRDLPPQYGKFGAVNRRYKRWCDKFLYKYRHLVENAFLKLKRWRGVATLWRVKQNLTEHQAKCSGTGILAVQ